MRRHHHSLRRRAIARQGQKGMTLLEIMIVIAILGMLAGVIVVAVMNQLENAKIKTTQLKIGQVKSAVNSYYANFNEYPSQSQGFKPLLNPPNGFRPMLEEEPKDDWGNPLMYFSPPKRGNAPFEIRSKGADGQEGTDDDLSSVKNSN